MCWSRLYLFQNITQSNNPSISGTENGIIDPLASKLPKKNLKKFPKKHLKTKIPKISETKFPYKKRKKLSKKTFQFFSNNKISIFFKLNFWPKISQQKYQNKKCLNKIVPCIQDDSHASSWLFVKPHLHPPWTKKNSCNVFQLVFLYGVICQNSELQRNFYFVVNFLLK